MTNRHSFVLGLFITASLLCASRTVWGNSEINTYTKTDFAMDTVVSETLYTTGEDITADVISALKDVEENWISWTKESSQIYQINQNAGNTTTVSDETATCLKQVLDLSKASGGAMDPTMGRVIRLWDIDGEDPHIPSDDELNSMLENVGYGKVTLDGNKVTMPKGVTLDLGAAGKGIGCDAAKKVLDADKNVSGMILNLGGSSVMSYGSKPDGSAWQVAVTDPRDTEGDYLGVVTLNGTEFLSTSGDYEKYFIEDGVRYHHILDPATGYPARSGLTSVTVVCDDGLNADGLSTACFVLGKEKAEELLKKYNADGLFVDDSDHVWMGYADTVFEVNATDANIVKPEAGEADTTALKAAVEKAEALKEADYTADSWKAMQLELQEAKDLLAKEKPTQAEVDEATTHLNAAVEALVKADTKVTVTLNKKTATVYKGKTTTLKATVTGADAPKVTFTSSNPKVAAVNKTTGKVTAKAKGTAVITAKCGDVKVTCKVTVKNPTLTLNKTSASVKVGKTTKITAKAAPSGKVTYKSGNKKIATVSSNGTIKGIKKGTAKITVTCNGVTKTVKVTVK